MRPSDRAWLWVAILGVSTYVTTWAVLGLVAPGYDPVTQAISELFAIGAPWWQRWSLSIVLAVTGVALVPLGPVLDRVLPGSGRLGPALTIAAGVGTALVVYFPCTPGCPGSAASFTDAMHAVTAGGGYIGLVLAPLAFARRLWATEWRRLAWAGIVLGGLATAGFLLRNLGPEAAPGALQRVFNTAADAWFVLAAVVALRRHAGGGSAGTAPDAAAD